MNDTETVEEIISRLQNDLSRKIKEARGFANARLMLAETQSFQGPTPSGYDCDFAKNQFLRLLSTAHEQFTIEIRQAMQTMSTSEIALANTSLKQALKEISLAQGPTISDIKTTRERLKNRNLQWRNNAQANNNAAAAASLGLEPVGDTPLRPPRNMTGPSTKDWRPDIEEIDYQSRKT